MFLLSADLLFFENFSQKSQCQTFWIQIRPKVLSDLIWVQTVCKGYEQTTLVGKELTESLSILAIQKNELGFNSA